MGSWNQKKRHTLRMDTDIRDSDIREGFFSVPNNHEMR